ncbi:hypothetical protein [Novosphingobium sp.]|uniref:hypothetical protein n=1 Tax=Novosphingobium sp. TaxID=1874826 RepID=UPI0025F95BD2|nr:hypothetical protein [Novosphingobium sp.]
MKFDSNQAWKDASASVMANRDVLLALAGVFIALPALALAIFMPPPEPPSGATPEAALALMGEYYTHSWLALLGIALLQLLGTLTMLTLFTDRSRPTVGEAIKRGARGVLPVIAAQVIMALGLGLLVSVLMIAAIASGAALLKLAAGLLLVGAVAYVLVRTALVSPIVIVEDQRNPIMALNRSWQLTKGSTGKLAGFFAILLVAAVVIYIVLAAGIGLIVSLIASGSTEAAIKDLIASFLQAVLSVYSVAIIAACHRQLAGPSAEVEARTFS